MPADQPSPQMTSREQLEALQRLDTPLVCNALELVAPDRRGFGFTTDNFMVARPDLPPVVGFARTVAIRARRPGWRSDAAARDYRLAYLKYIADGPKPSIVVVQDLDGAAAGCGAFWGEVHSSMHKALGAVGAVTDGAMRDIEVLASGFQLLARKIVPSHACDHLVDFGDEVNVCGMVVQSGDLAGC